MGVTLPFDNGRAFAVRFPRSPVAVLAAGAPALLLCLSGAVVKAGLIAA